MHAVILTGGKQHRVAEGDTIRIEKLTDEIGQAVVFDKVLMIGNGDNIKVGAPYLDGAQVKAEVLEQGRDKKVHIIKFKRRKHHLKRQGHRQYFTDVKITAIEG